MKKELKVALIQAPLIWENPDENIAYFSQKMDAIPNGTDLVVLPEMFTTGFTMTPHHLNENEGGKALEWMLSMAKKKEVALIGSIAFFEKGTYANRLFFVPPNGKFSHYDKRHTFTLAGEDKVYLAGAKKLIVNYKGFKICPLICYDLRFPVWARNTEDYDVVLYVANWPKPRIAAWDTLLRARAIENMAYCIGVNRVGLDESGHAYIGHSAVYDPLGEQLTFSEEEVILYAILSKERITQTRDRLKFLEDRDHFTVQE